MGPQHLLDERRTEKRLRQQVRLWKKPLAAFLRKPPYPVMDTTKALRKPLPHSLSRPLTVRNRATQQGSREQSGPNDLY